MAKNYSQMTVGDFFAQEDAKDDEKGSTDRIKALEAQIEGLTLKLKAVEAPVELAEDAFDFPEQPQLIPLSFEDLPDMYTDAKAYQAALAQRIQENTIINQRLQRKWENDVAAAEAAQKGRADALWSEFSEKYPKLKDHEDVVRFVAEKTAFEKQRAGVDVTSYIFKSKDKFFEDVASGAAKFLPKDAEEAKVEDTVDAERTSVFGGTFSAFKPGAVDAEKGKGDMVSDLHKLHQVSGFY